MGFILLSKSATKEMVPVLGAPKARQNVAQKAQ